MNDKHTLCCVCLKEIHHTIACNMCSADCSDCIFDYNYEFKDENQNILICICKQFMKLYFLFWSCQEEVLTLLLF